MAYKVGDKVKADCEEGWLPGVVVKANASGTKYKVELDNDEGTINFDAGDLKPARGKKAQEAGVISSVEDAEAFLENLSDDSYLMLMAAANAVGEKRIKFGQVLKVAFRDGVGYGLCVGGGATCKIWRVGHPQFTYFPVPWNCIRLTEEMVEVERKGHPTDASRTVLLKKYGK